MTGNAVNVPIGTYLITFGGSGYSNGSSVEQAALYVNGAATTEKVTFYSTAKSNTVTASKTVVMKFTAAAKLSLVNTSGASITYDAGFITVTQLSTTV